MHEDMKKYEYEIKGCKEAREWLDYYGESCTSGGDPLTGARSHLTQQAGSYELRCGQVNLWVQAPGGRHRHDSNRVVDDALRGLLLGRWPELSMALRVTIDKREAVARTALRELANKILEEVK